MTLPPTYVKRRRGAPPEYFRREADGLRWLAEVSGGAPVPDVLAVDTQSLTISRITTKSPSRAEARRFGAELAKTHAAGAASFGAPPPSDSPATGGFIADLPLPYGNWESFGPFYARARVAPYLAMLGAGQEVAVPGIFAELMADLEADDRALVGPPERPSRLHGDLWSGNVVWGPDGSSEVRGWLIDPAAHGGHRETDLAMLQLFGAPHLADILAGYQATTPLSQGWQGRVALHQVHPLLVHAALFGGGYLTQAARAAHEALRDAK